MIDVNAIAELLCQATEDEVKAINSAIRERCNKYVINTIPPNTTIGLP